MQMLSNPLRSDRLDVIRALLDRHSVTSQEQLAELLVAEGYTSTQSSISRDLRDLRVGKIQGRYVITAVEPEALAGILKASPAGPNLIVLKTAIGAANLVALHIDQAEISGVLGTVAGDDTIFIAVESAEAQAAVLKQLGMDAHV